MMLSRCCPPLMNFNVWYRANSKMISYICSVKIEDLVILFGLMVSKEDLVVYLPDPFLLSYWEIQKI